MNRLDLIPMIVSEGLTLWLLVLINRRGAWERVPFFGLYIAYSSIAAVVRMLFSSSYDTFFYTFWGTETVYLVLSVLCMYKAFYCVFRGMMLLRWFRWLYPVTFLLVIFYAVLKDIKWPPIEGYPITGVIIGVEIGAQYLIAATFFLFCAAMYWVKIVDFGYYKGVVLGFGASSIGMLLGSLVRSEFGTRFAAFSKFMPTVAYLLALAIWLSAFYTPLPDEQPTTERRLTPEFAERELKQYQLTLRKAVRWK